MEENIKCEAKKIVKEILLHEGTNPHIKNFIQISKDAISKVSTFNNEDLVFGSNKKSVPLSPIETIKDLITAAKKELQDSKINVLLIEDDSMFYDNVMRKVILAKIKRSL
jgi:hypothetical protein